MKELAKMLKRFGPRWSVEWRYDHHIRNMIIKLTYIVEEWKIRAQDQYAVDYQLVEYLDEHGPRILEEMERRILASLRERWGKDGVTYEEKV